MELCGEGHAGRAFFQGLLLGSKLGSGAGIDFQVSPKPQTLNPKL